MKGKIFPSKYRYQRLSRVQRDFNDWKPNREYDFALALQSRGFIQKNPWKNYVEYLARVSLGNLPYRKSLYRSNSPKIQSTTIRTKTRIL